MTMALAFIGFVIFVILALAVLGHLSRSGQAPGLKEGKLTPCAPRPNCVCSEYPDDRKHIVLPLEFTGDDPTIILRRVITDMGGDLAVDQDGYVAAIFKSRFFGFADDFELRIDGDNRVIHLRSASRIGYSDRGVNRKRVKRFKTLFATAQ